MILLDTCTLLWLARGEGLPAGVSDRIAGTDAVFVSAVSALEIGIKVSKGRLILPLAPAAWWPAVLAHFDLAEVPVDGEIATRAAALPSLHADPAGRLIVATALHLGATVLTPDTAIQGYPGVRWSWG